MVFKKISQHMCRLNSFNGELNRYLYNIVFGHRNFRIYLLEKSENEKKKNFSNIFRCTRTKGTLLTFVVCHLPFHPTYTRCCAANKASTVTTAIITIVVPLLQAEFIMHCKPFKTSFFRDAYFTSENCHFHGLSYSGWRW